MTTQKDTMPDEILAYDSGQWDVSKTYAEYGAKYVRADIVQAKDEDRGQRPDPDWKRSFSIANEVVGQLQDEIKVKDAQIEKLVEALRSIACYEDDAAGRMLANTGSYAGFDEPGSVFMARKALAQYEKEESDV